MRIYNDMPILRLYQDISERRRYSSRSPRDPRAWQLPRFAAGQDMFVAGDAAESMIVIVDGEAEAKCKNGKVVACPWMCYRDPFEFITRRFNESQFPKVARLTTGAAGALVTHMSYHMADGRKPLGRWRASWQSWVSFPFAQQLSQLPANQMPSLDV